MNIEEISKFYLENERNFEKTRKITGMSTLKLHLTLAKAGVLTITDKVNYGTRNAKLGGKAEELFQKLIPEALPVNGYKANNPEFDFVYKNLTIDVKFSSLFSRGKSKYWRVRTKGNPDLYVIFLERDEGDELENPYILLFPSVFKETKSVHISSKGDLFKEFRVYKDDLAEMLKEYGELKEAGEKN